VEHEPNFYDELNSGVDVAEAQRQTDDAKARAEKLDYLIHRIFQQNKDGQELLKTWKETLIMSVGADEGMDLISVGIKEGYKRFIRNIILTISRVEQS
jgi:hypothetical protein